MNLDDARAALNALTHGRSVDVYEAVLAVVDAAIGGHWHDHTHRGPTDGPASITGKNQIIHTAQYPLRALPVVTEPPEALTGVLRPDDAPEGSEGQGEAREAPKCGAPTGGGPCILPAGHNQGRLDIPDNHLGARRPGRTPPPPTMAEVLTRIQALCAEAGVGGYAPLSLHEAVEALIARLKTQQAEARQWHESASHHRQIAAHYRDALVDLCRAGSAHIDARHDGHSETLSEALMKARRARDVPVVWDGRLI